MKEIHRGQHTLLFPERTEKFARVQIEELLISLALGQAERRGQDGGEKTGQMSIPSFYEEAG